MLALKQAGFFVRTAILQGAPHYLGSDPIDEPGSFSGFLAPRLMRFLAGEALAHCGSAEHIRARDPAVDAARIDGTSTKAPEQCRG